MIAFILFNVSLTRDDLGSNILTFLADFPCIQFDISLPHPHWVVIAVVAGEAKEELEKTVEDDRHGYLFLFLHIVFPMIY